MFAPAFTSMFAPMLRQLHQFTIPTAISIAFFDATYFMIAHVFSFSGREVVLGVAAGAAGGLSVLVAVLWQAAKEAQSEAAAAPAAEVSGN